MTIKEWFYDKTENTSSYYNLFIDKTDNNDGTVTVVVEEKLDESDKAVKVRLSTGDVVGSCKGWTTWIPKSVIVK